MTSPFNWQNTPRQTKDEPKRYVPNSPRFHIYSRAGTK